MNLLLSKANSARKKLVEKLKRKKYRDAYVLEHVKTGTAYQIRAIREERGWTQSELGREAKKPQNVVSRLEDPDYGKLSIKTLLEIASAFDVALLVKFVPFTRLLSEYEDVSPTNLVAKGFNDEVGVLEKWAAVKNTRDQIFHSKPKTQQPFLTYFTITNSSPKPAVIKPAIPGGFDIAKSFQQKPQWTSPQISQGDSTTDLDLVQVHQ